MRLFIIAILLVIIVGQTQLPHISHLTNVNQAVDQSKWIWFMHYTTNDYDQLNPRLFVKTNCRVLHFTFTNGLYDDYMFELSPSEFQMLWTNYPQFQQTNLIEFGKPQ